MTKIEYILDVDDFLKRSKQVDDKIATTLEKKGGNITAKDTWRIIDNQIKRKVKNSGTVKGVCNCEDDMMCKHRKKYLKVILNGRKTY
jgi:hypothetical protein